MLYKLVGFTAFAALGTMLCLAPYQSTIARLVMHSQNQVLSAADDRLTLTTESFQAIKVVKLFAWEQQFAQTLAETREVELQALRKKVAFCALGGVSMCQSVFVSPIRPMKVLHC